MANEGPTSSGRFGSEAQGVRGSEAANRQLRRRYESLRDDYGELLDRLSEVEGRLQRAEEPGADLPDVSGMAAAVAEAISAPLFALRDQYVQAARELAALADAVEELGWRTFKGQRPARASEAARTPGAGPEQPDEAKTVDVSVDSGNLGALLDFQERVSNLPGVTRVSLSQIHEDRAILTVELESGG